MILVHHFNRLTNLDSDIRLEIYRCLFLLPDHHLVHKGRLPREDSDHSSLSPQILRANRQVYSEAFSVLYSEVPVRLELGDILSLPGDHERFIGKRNKNIWRHNPLDGIGRCDNRGRHLYSTPQMDGVMEPHVFARFRKVVLYADFEFIGGDEICNEPNCCADPRLGINGDFSLDPDYIPFFVDSLNQSNVIELFVKLLSNSPYVHHLGLLLSAEVEADYDNGMNGAEDEETDAKFDDAGDEAAVELLMDSRMLDPLRELSNVQCFEFKFNMFLQTKEFEPQPRHVNMIEALRHEIEANWRPQQEAWQLGSASEMGA